MPSEEPLNDLLNALLPHAQELLRKYGEFFPFGAAIDDSGDVRMVAAGTGDEHPASQEVIDILLNGMKAEAGAGSIAAAGICLDSTFNLEGSPMKDAVCCRLESHGGESLQVYLPYVAKKHFRSSKKTFEFGELVAMGKVPEIWPVS
ncbi:hypothetical protein SAMN05421819_3515 [Bryocella elongata]|uniref:Uncharacterized protein n=1 Tax=Bryocella elongata TaxID=863522 RepID=A0A1H6B569_9BACT|nr:hypothetical protein [Bryocella elongata]SEG55694.1 hypothetical protein SAMN05421819_3515 [Bryocella elongata]